jgi:hypothetical protein
MAGAHSADEVPMQRGRGDERAVLDGLLDPSHDGKPQPLVRPVARVSVAFPRRNASAARRPPVVRLALTAVRC